MLCLSHVHTCFTMLSSQWPCVSKIQSVTSADVLHIFFPHSNLMLHKCWVRHFNRCVSQFCGQSDLALMPFLGCGDVPRGDSTVSLVSHDNSSFGTGGFLRQLFGPREGGFLQQDKLYWIIFIFFWGHRDSFLHFIVCLPLYVCACMQACVYIQCMICLNFWCKLSLLVKMYSIF
jgi:hypothetical protein